MANILWSLELLESLLEVRGEEWRVTWLEDMDLQMVFSFISRISLNLS